MTQVNVNNTPGGPVDDGGGAVGAGINLITVLVIAAVLIVVAWFIFSGPLQSLTRGGGDVNINVNPPAQQQQPASPKVEIETPRKP